MDHETKDQRHSKWKDESSEQRSYWGLDEQKEILLCECDGLVEAKIVFNRGWTAEA